MINFNSLKTLGLSKCFIISFLDSNHISRITCLNKLSVSSIKSLILCKIIFKIRLKPNYWNKFVDKIKNKLKLNLIANVWTYLLKDFLYSNL